MKRRTLTLEPIENWFELYKLHFDEYLRDKTVDMAAPATSRYPAWLLAHYPDVARDVFPGYVLRVEIIRLLLPYPS